VLHVRSETARGAEQGTGEPAQPQPAAESVRPFLPIEAAAAEVILMAGPRPGTPGTPPGQWRTVAAFPLG
jgi:hypothetical protein